MGFDEEQPASDDARRLGARSPSASSRVGHDEEPNGCGAAASDGGGELSGKIAIDGSSTVAPFAEAAAELFQEGNSGVQITVGTSGTGGGFDRDPRDDGRAPADELGRRSSFAIAMSRSGDSILPEYVTDQRRQEEAVVTPATAPASVAARKAAPSPRDVIFDVDDINVYYGDHKAIRDVSLDLHLNEITALVGPSGCGKSTFIRCLNRMNDLIPSARVEGKVVYHGEDLYAPDIDPVQVRKRIGMVFQKPNPFPKSIYDNIAFGPRVMGMKGDMDEIVESALRRGALWDEVKDRLKMNAFGMSGGQQQRLCIARALATEPDVLLMDEPCSALDPISTGRIEDLMFELKQDYSIVIVTHNMQQAARVSDMTAFFTVELHDEGRSRTGAVVEYGETDRIFTNPDDKRTEDYVTGKFG
jgi:phosphate transport system ATP-binding protein